VLSPGVSASVIPFLKGRQASPHLLIFLGYVGKHVMFSSPLPRLLLLLVFPVFPGALPLRLGRLRAGSGVGLRFLH